MANLDSVLKRKNIILPTSSISQSYGFSSSHIWMWETIKKAEHWRTDGFWPVVLERTLESSTDCKEIKSVNPKENQFLILIGRTDTETETPVLWPLLAKRQLIRKDSYAGKDWTQKEKGVTEDDMVGWHHWLSGHVFEQAPGGGEGQRSLACCNSWGCKQSDIT